MKEQLHNFFLGCGNELIRDLNTTLEANELILGLVAHEIK